jgi:RNA polymerase sigma-70 factor (ECF subfamily)
MVALHHERHVADAAVPPKLESAEQLFTETYETYFAFVWRTLRALGVPTAALDDAAQDVFVVVQRRLGEFEHRSSLKTWLFGIAYRVAGNARRSARRHEALALPSEISSSHPGPHELTERAEAAAFVERFLDGVDEAQRAAFTACVLEEMSVPDAAEALGVNVNTLYSRLRAVRAKFLAAAAERGES